MDLLSEAKLREHVIQQLNDIGGRQRSDEILILCPFHDDSNPSLGVHIGHKLTPGVFHCWSCGASGGWNKLADALRLAPVEYQKIQKVTDKEDPFQVLNTALKRDPVLLSKEPKIQKGLEELTNDVKWRGLGARFLKSLGAQFYWHRKTDVDYLHFPIEMNGVYQGYTLIALSKHAKDKYLIFADTTKNFFLYDQLPENDYIILVEGHHDTLRLVAEGFPVAGIFGIESWSPTKRQYIVAKNPKKVLLLFDGDEGGRRATQEIFLDLRAGTNVDVFYLPIKEGGKLDPGNMPDEFLPQIHEKLYE